MAWGRTYRRDRLAPAALASSVLALAACAPLALSEEPESTRHELTVIGDRHLYLDAGTRIELSVRYHDEDGEPGSGIVDFAIRGDAGGARLQSPATTTDSSGVAKVTLDASAGAQASFSVEASALNVSAVEWTITVEAPAAPLDPRGHYRIDSRFDVLSGLQESALSDAIDGVSDFTRDPGTVLLASAAEQGWISEEEARTTAHELTPFLEDQAPLELARLRELGGHFGDVSGDVGVVSTLEIDSDRGMLTGEHVLGGLVITLAGEEHPFSLGELGAQPEPQHVGLAISDDDGRLIVAEHRFSIPYGVMLELALERILVAQLDEPASDLASFLHEHVPCLPISDWLGDQFHLDPVVADLACRDAVTSAAEDLLAGIEGLDAAGFELVIAGDARPGARRGDGRLGGLMDGSWQGVIEHGGAPTAKLEAHLNEFRGERITD